MRIERVHIQNFKSIADVTIEGLSDINVFYGRNDVGKSNILEAISLWQWVILNQDISAAAFETEFGMSVFRLGGGSEIVVDIDISLDQEQWKKVTMLLIGRGIKIEIPSIASQERTQIKTQIVCQRLVSTVSCSFKANVEGQLPLNKLELLLVFPAYLLIEATRRLQVELRATSNGLGLIKHSNLKQALFYAYLSRDLEQKQRLAAIKRILSEPPYSLGELDVALDPTIDRIEIGFVRPDGRLPIENLGSGSQQLLLMLGQIFLNDYPIVALEEPEMNLSPQHQQHLLIALRQLMQDPAVRLNQLFISTHSPYFEFEETFFDVTQDEQGTTQVQRLSVEQRARHFPPPELGPNTGARLNSLHQVRLYDGLIEDLELKRGDLVLFVKNDVGRWEIRPEDEIIAELEAASNHKG